MKLKPILTWYTYGKAGRMIALAIGVVSVLAVVLAAQTAFAGGGAGSGGNSGSCGGYCTDYGYGWMKYSSTGPGPGAYSGRGFLWVSPWTWAQVSATCQSYNTQYVWVFVSYDSSQSKYHAVGMNFQASDSNYTSVYGTNYVGEASPSQAHSYYNDAVSRGIAGTSGLTWGDNIAWFCYSDQAQWSINGQSYIKNSWNPSISGLSQGTITAYPGDRLNWYHDMRNNGPNNMDRNVYFNVDKTGFSNGWNGIKDPRGYARGAAGQLFVTEYASYPSPYTLYDVTESDVGNTLCQRIAWTDASWNQPGAWGVSGYACARVPYNFSLTPSISLTNPPSITSGATVTIKSGVTDIGRTKSTPAQWQERMFVIPPGGPNPSTSVAINSTAPATQFPGSSLFPDATNGQGSGKVFYPESGGYNLLRNDAYSLPLLPVGSRVCWVLSVQPYTQSDGRWVHGIPVCVVISKTPLVQISGGDTTVGRSGLSTNIVVSRFSITGGASPGTYGSWAEYAAFAPGTSNIATGGNLATATTRTAPSPSGNSGQPLTFANNNSVPTCGGMDGCYGTTGSQLNLAAQYSGTPSGYTATLPMSAWSGGVLNLDNLVPGNRYYLATTTAMKVHGTLKAGVSVIVVDTANDITIDGNIALAPGPYTDLSQIPQVLLLTNNNIQINNTVVNVDAWLYAGGIVSTCDAPITSGTYTAGLGAGAAYPCDGKHLTINGPVSAGHLQLRRTYGADVTQGGPAMTAESFNLNPDAYLWAQNQSISTGAVTTVYTLNLPPRY